MVKKRKLVKGRSPKSAPRTGASQHSSRPPSKSAKKRSSISPKAGKMLKKKIKSKVLGAGKVKKTIKKTVKKVKTTRKIKITSLKKKGKTAKKMGRAGKTTKKLKKIIKKIKKIKKSIKKIKTVKKSIRKPIKSKRIKKLKTKKQRKSIVKKPKIKKITKKKAKELLKKKVPKPNLELLKRLSEPKVREALVEHAGENALPLLKSFEGSTSDDELSKTLKIKISDVRAALNKLHTLGIVRYNRTRDTETGWFSYFWTINSQKMNEWSETVQEKHEKEFVLPEGDHYFCPKCKRDSIHNFDSASEYGFRCPLCSSSLDFLEEKHIPKLFGEIVPKRMRL
ncbi:hypothetical protein KAW38_00875 [Candidatus Micrarchaeota archaeon]|nr:hypothetical protein [Candidatus Micrarchaeota archaeon]